MATESVILLDDRLLIEELLVGLPVAAGAGLYTTTYWYYRACRAAVAGAGGQLSGPFDQLSPGEQETAIASLLELRADIGLPDPRTTVPTMVDVFRRHVRLNLLNLEAVAAALHLKASIWLSEAGAAGVLRPILDVEGITWRTINVPT